MIVLLFALFSLFVSDIAYGEDVWTKGQLMENLKSGAVREITIVPGGIKGKYFDSYGREEIFFVPEKTPGEYPSFSPEVIALIQKHGVRVIPEEKERGAALINYGALFLEISSWIIIVIGAILLIMINTKLKKILEILSKKQA